jgi:hypothetical protein
MNQEELKRSSDAQAEDCLRHRPTRPIEEIKRIISQHICDAYRLGVQDEKILHDKLDIEDEQPEFNSSN